MDKATWLITGASSGLGYALAEHVLEQGDQVVLGARTLDPMTALSKRYPNPLEAPVMSHVALSI